MLGWERDRMAEVRAGMVEVRLGCRGEPGMAKVKVKMAEMRPEWQK